MKTGDGVGDGVTDTGDGVLKTGDGVGDGVSKAGDGVFTVGGGVSNDGEGVSMTGDGVSESEDVVLSMGARVTANGAGVFMTGAGVLSGDAGLVGPQDSSQALSIFPTSRLSLLLGIQEHVSSVHLVDHNMCACSFVALTTQP